MNIFFLALGRDASDVYSKANELDRLGYPYLIICGEKTDRSNVIFREPKGKYDALNFGLEHIPKGTDVVVLNDADTEIHNFEAALSAIRNSDAALVFARVSVRLGPQQTFYSFLDTLRRIVPIAASGELMLVRYRLLKEMTPLKACKAEDTYILFKTMERGGKAIFSEQCYVTTTRTSDSIQEEAYKRRTVGGIYQALSMSDPPVMVKLFYLLLPLVSPLLLVLGKKGYYWTKGILLGYIDYLRGDTTGSWKRNY